MFVLTCYTPDEIDVLVLFVSSSKDKLQPLVDQFNEQIGGKTFDKCPEQIVLGDIVLKKDEDINYMYSNDNLHIAYDSYLSIHEVKEI